MDQTFLNLISLIVDLSNRINALQQENAALKANLPVHDAPEIDPNRDG